jgi:hypothetical protein
MAEIQRVKIDPDLLRSEYHSKIRIKWKPQKKNIGGESGRVFAESAVRRYIEE